MLNFFDNMLMQVEECAQMWHAVGTDFNLHLFAKLLALYTWCYSGLTLLCMIGTVAATPGLSSLCCLCQVKWHGHAQYHRIYKFCCHCYPPMPMFEIVPRVCMLVAWVLLGLKVGWCPSEGMLPKSKYNTSACCYGSYEWLLLCITTVAASAYTFCWGMCIPSTLAAALWKAGCLELPALLLESKCCYFWCSCLFMTVQCSKSSFPFR